MPSSCAPPRPSAITGAALDRAVRRLARSGAPRSRRAELLVSFARRHGAPLDEGHLVSLDLPPSLAVRAAESAGLRLSLRQLLGRPRECGTDPHGADCVEHAAEIAAHCAPLHLPDLFRLLPLAAPRFLRGAGLSVTLDELRQDPTDAPLLALVREGVVAGADLESLRRFYSGRRAGGIAQVARVCAAAGVVPALTDLVEMSGGTRYFPFFHDVGEAEVAVFIAGVALDPRLAVQLRFGSASVVRLLVRDAHTPEAQAFMRAGVSSLRAELGDRRVWVWMGILRFKAHLRRAQRAWRRFLARRAATRIQRAWRHRAADPRHALGRRRLARLFAEMRT